VPGEARAAPRGTITVRNRTVDSAEIPAESLVSTDALALVRFGLRAPNDPRVVDTVRVIDHVLRQELPNGPGWHRYNGDGYGEHDDGSPFDGTGTGRVWPLLAGERALYELAAGHGAEARRLLATMEANASPGKLLPEQVWDGPPIPERELLPGGPSGSAMPLAWAHAEHLKLLRSLADGAVFDLPPQPVRRYQRDRKAPRVRSWRPDWRAPSIPAGRVLRIELPETSVVAWSMDGGRTRQETPTWDTGLGVHVVELPAAQARDSIAFTWRRTAADAGNSETFVVAVE
jgi:glucoamylase